MHVFLRVLVSHSQQLYVILINFIILFVTNTTPEPNYKLNEQTHTSRKQMPYTNRPLTQLLSWLLQAYISCALGVHRVGYVMICFGVVNAACSLLFGSLMKFVGRQPLMALGAVVHAALIGVLLIWRPHPDSSYVFYTVSGLWGVGDAVWQTQVNGEFCLSLLFLHRFKLFCRLVYSYVLSKKKSFSFYFWSLQSEKYVILKKKNK